MFGFQKGRGHWAMATGVPCGCLTRLCCCLALPFCYYYMLFLAPFYYILFYFFIPWAAQRWNWVVSKSNKIKNIMLIVWDCYLSHIIPYQSQRSYCLLMLNSIKGFFLHKGHLILHIVITEANVLKSQVLSSDHNSVPILPSNSLYMHKCSSDYLNPLCFFWENTVYGAKSDYSLSTFCSFRHRGWITQQPHHPQSTIVPLLFLGRVIEQKVALGQKLFQIK